jgi:hypothetical protein
MITAIKILHWVPRILCILAILFVSLFALDSFDGDRSFGEKILEFLIHLIPSFILTILLIVAWKWELAGGIIFAIIGIGFTPFIFSWNYHMNQSVWMSLGIVLAITFPFIVVGGLFILSYFKKKRKNIRAVS